MVTVRRHHHIAPVEPMRRSATPRASVRVGTSRRVSLHIDTIAINDSLSRRCGDGELDKRELAGRLSAKELAAADPDHDGTLTADEYLAVVEQRFNAANPDKDGTLDAKELNSSAGRALLRLLK